MSKDQLNALPRGYEIEGYRIEAILGSGGFGITYKAREISLDRLVAIKEYLPAGIATRGRDLVTVYPMSSDDRSNFEWGLSRFRVEAQTLVAFRHPNIVEVLRFFEANDTAYMVMGYEAGESLDEVLEREGTMEEAEIRAILDPLLDGLAEVHEAGFLHRDIKPANIFLRESGQPVMLDFGAARQAMGNKSQSLTAIVTSGYAPHEQYESDGDQGAWTDIYAMGAVLYRAISGAVPTEAPMRLSAYARENKDPMIPANEVGLGRYSIAFLDSVDGALRIMERDRPCSVSEWQEWLAGEPVEGPRKRPGTVVPLELYRSAQPAKKTRSKGHRRAIAAMLAVLVISGVSSGGYVAYTEILSKQTEYETALERERALASAAKQKINVLAQQQALANQRRAKAELGIRQAEKTIAEARKRAKAEAIRVSNVKRKLTAEQRKAKEARQLVILERQRAQIESRKRASAEATRSLESLTRRRIAQAQRKAIKEERKLAAKQRWLLKVERRKAIKESRRLEVELRKARESRRKAELALREYKRKVRRRAKSNRGRTTQVARMPNIVRPSPYARPGARNSPRAQNANPWRQPFRGRPARLAGTRQLFGRWCGPKGALRFTRTHMVATRYDTGQTGRYQLAGYRNNRRAIVVQYLLPDGMHRVAFGNFSPDSSRMVEMAMKRPGYPWRRLGVAWHRC